MVLVVFRLHHDKDGVNDDAYAAEAAGAEPEDSRPDLAFVEAVHAEIPQQNAEGKRYPFVVFTLSGHSCSFFLKDRKMRCPVLLLAGEIPVFFILSCMEKRLQAVFLMAVFFCLVCCSNSETFFLPVEEETSDRGGMVLVRSFGRSVTLGTENEKAPPDVHPAMKVTFDYDFSISSHEVTRSEYYSEVVSGRAPDGWMKDMTPDSGNYPMVQVTFYDAVLYANAKSKGDRLDTVYTYDEVVLDGDGNCSSLGNLLFHPEVEGYRLPTEAEWTIVAESHWNPGKSWNLERSENSLHEVCTEGNGGESLPVCDMAGNVMEWVNDWKGAFTDGEVSNFVGANDGGTMGERVLKGGSFHNAASSMRIYSRGDVYTVTSSTKSGYVGFRLAYGAIPTPTWLSGGTPVAKSNYSLLAKAEKVQEEMGTRHAKLVFRNITSKKLAYVDYGAIPLAVKEIEDTLEAYHPELSPDGEWVAFCTGIEGVSRQSSLYVRRLGVAGANLVRLDVESAAIPRWKVLDSGDTVIVYVTSAANNRDAAVFKAASTWQVKFSDGKFGIPEKLFDGAYHGGISEDNSLAVTGARLFHIRRVGISDRVQEETWYNGEQVCNVSLSKDGTDRSLFLDFGGKTGRDFTAVNYGVHGMLLVADKTGKLVQGIPAPRNYTFDHTEWARGNSGYVVTSLMNSEGSHSKISLLDTSDSSFVDLLGGDDLWHPSLWARPEPKAVAESELDLDSACVYLTPYAGSRARIMKVKMDLFWKYRETAEAVAIGSSRSFSGFDPRSFSSLFAINLSYSSQDLISTEYFVRNYIVPLMPKLKMIVLSLDFDRWDTDGGDFQKYFSAIPGYQYDKSHGFWADGVPPEMAEIAENSPALDSSEAGLYSFHRGLYFSTTAGWGEDPPSIDGSASWYRKSKRKFEYNLELLKKILGIAKEKGVVVVGVLFPQSPLYRENGVWGRYGLDESSADEIRDIVIGLTREFPGFIVVDLYRNGQHVFEYGDFANEDHLNLGGATKATWLIDNYLKALLN